MNRALALCAFALIAFAGVAPSSSAPVPPPYSAEQARKGQILFYEQCAECHGDRMQGHFGPALSGGDDNVQWATVSYIWIYMTGHMPAGNAGGLSQEEYLDIMAFLLKEHGNLPSRTPLTVEAANESKALFGPP